MRSCNGVNVSLPIQGTYTAYTLTPIPVPTRDDAAKYFCAYPGCSLRFDTPCDLQRHRLRSGCSALSHNASVFDTLGSPLHSAAGADLVANRRCQLCYEFISSCSYRMLVEHVRTDHCGLELPGSDQFYPASSSRPFGQSTTICVGENHSQLASAAETTASEYLYGRTTQSHYTQPRQLFGSNLGSGKSSNESLVSSPLTLQGAEHVNGGRMAKYQGLDWEKYKPVLHRLYVDEDRNLDLVMDHMADTYGLTAKKRTYKEKLKIWGFEKNVPARDMRLIVDMVEKRKREGKESRMFYKDRLVDTKKMERFKKRKLGSELDDNSSLGTRYVRCETPPVESEVIEILNGPNEVPHTVKIMPRSADLETLGAVLLSEYNGQSGHADTQSRTHSRHRTNSHFQCRSSYAGYLDDLFAKAYNCETQGDAKNGENLYLSLLDMPFSDKDSGVVLDALRGIIRVRAIGCEYTSALPEFERLVAGCLCLFGPSHATYRELGVELAICYYKLDRYDEGNALVKRMLSIYKDYTGSINEDSCARLLYWASGRVIGLNKVPHFGHLYDRLISQYEQNGRLESAMVLATDVVDGLQFSSDFEEAEYYLCSACKLYERFGERGQHHVEMLTSILLVQCVGFPTLTSVDETLVDKLQNDIICRHNPKETGALPVLPLTRLALCYATLHRYGKAQQLYILLDLEDKALRASCSREDWKVIIAGLGDQACNFASLSEWSSAEGLFILAEELALRELGPKNWRTRMAVKQLNAFHHRDPDLWSGRRISPSEA